MKKTILPVFALIAIVVVLNSCKLLDKLTQFNVDYSTTFTIPPSSLLGGIGVPLNVPGSSADQVTTNSAQTFSNNNTSADHIKSVNLKTLKLTITSPSGKKFDFLKSAILYISADGLPKIQVASIDNIDDATVGNTINLTPVTADLKDYLIKSTYTVSETVTTSQNNTDNVDIKADATFLVQGKLLK